MALALADADEGVLVPDVPAPVVPEVPAAPAPAGWVFNTNFDSLDALVLPDVPVDPGVALGAALERSMQPVTVTLLAELELELGVCDEGGVVCAATAIASVHTIAAHNPNDTLCFIVSSIISFIAVGTVSGARPTPRSFTGQRAHATRRHEGAFKGSDDGRMRFWRTDDLNNCAGSRGEWLT